jgi:predicted Zn-ribbon and HTH transcriptional regulator
MENTEEMHILGKYKYIRFLKNQITQVVKNTVTPSQAFNLTETTKVEAIEKELTDKEKKLAEKLAKKQKMLELCKPKNNKPAYVAKEKYVNTTPWGEKKGKHKC